MSYEHGDEGSRPRLQRFGRRVPMDRDALRRQAQTSARASLELLASTFAGDAAAQDRIRRMLEEFDHLDQKPVVAAPESARGCGGSGSEVLVSAGGSSSNALESGGSSEKMLALDAQGASGHPARLDEPEPVGTLAASEASSSSSTLSAERASGSSAPDAKRQRRESAAALPTSLDQFPPHGCEVLIARRDGEPIYCAVVGHTPAGCLLVDVPGEAGPVERSVHGLRTGLGAEMRPLVRAKPEQWLQPRTEDLRTAEEQLEASALRRSEGRTREQLNAHLPSLPGLFACFGVPVVSAKGGAVSQLTFNIEQWNDLPQSESVPFEWW